MNKFHSLQELAPIGVAVFSAITTTVGSVLIVPLANAAILEIEGPNIGATCSGTSIECLGTLGQFQTEGPVTIGDKLFTFDDQTGLSDDDLVLFVLDVPTDQYILDLDLVGTTSDVQAFTLDYTVDVLDSNEQIVAVDLDSTVNAFLPDEELITLFNGTQLESIGGGPVVQDLIPPATSVFVENTYTGSVGTEIFSFENSFEQHTSSVPEPTTILGLITIGGLSLGLKRNKRVIKS